MNGNKIRDGLFGVCAGDALGLPFEGEPRTVMDRYPAAGMTGLEAYGLPPGTWSDDSSLTFCLAESLCEGYDLDDIGRRFQKWLFEGYWTPFGRAIGMGLTTVRAIERLRAGTDPGRSGERGEYSNGNGSLMRILPLAFFLAGRDDDADTRFKMIHEVSAITHAHPRSLITCGIYVTFALALLRGLGPRGAYDRTREETIHRYRQEPFKSELDHFARILNSDVSLLERREISSSGYVLHTLEASLWCLLNHGDYASTVLEAVNLGEDTDTTGAVAGGLAGILYGYEGIPREWIDVILRGEDIEDLATRLDKSLKR